MANRKTVTLIEELTHIVSLLRIGMSEREGREGGSL